MRSDAKYLEISHLTKVYPKPGGGEAVIVRDFDFAIAEGRVRLPDRPLRLRQVDGAVDRGGAAPADGGRRAGRRQGDPGAGAGPRRRVPVALPAAVDDGVRERDAGRRGGQAGGDARRARRRS